MSVRTNIAIFIQFDLWLLVVFRQATEERAFYDYGKAVADIHIALTCHGKYDTFAIGKQTEDTAF